MIDIEYMLCGGTCYFILFIYYTYITKYNKIQKYLQYFNLDFLIQNNI